MSLIKTLEYMTKILWVKVVPNPPYITFEVPIKVNYKIASTTLD